MKSNIFFLLLLVILSTCLSILGTIIPNISGSFLDKLIEQQSMKPIYNVVVLLFFIGFFQLLLSFVLSIVGALFTEKLAFVMRKKSFELLLKKELEYAKIFDEKGTNQIIYSDSEVISNFCLSIISSLLATGVSILVATFFMGRLSMIITILIYISLLFYFIFLRILKPYLQSKNLLFKNSYTNYFGIFSDLISNLRVIRLNDKKNESLIIFRKKFDNYLDSVLSYKKVSFSFQSGDLFISVLTQIIIFLIGGKSYTEGNLSIGDITILLAYYNILFGGMKNISGFYTSYVTAKVSLDRLTGIVDYKSFQNAPFLEFEGQLNRIELRNVRFSHLGDSKEFTFSYSFEKGKIYLLNGQNGVGKTTLLNLISSIFSTRYNGEILFNDYDIRSLDKDKLIESHISVVPQDEQYTGGLYLYLSYQDIGEDIFNLFEKYKLSSELDMQEKLNLSGGENRKVSIMTALNKKFDLLILDEPTNQLDGCSKDTLVSYLENIKKDKIIIVSSHDEIFEQISDQIISLE